jgi:5,6-dimethylbenzimidazole synthase
VDVYEAIYKRRDVRHFRPDPVPDEALRRVLDAAHHAGSVGFMQPWNFLVIRSSETKKRVFDLYQEANVKAAAIYTGERRALYDSLKLAGIMEAAVNLAVTCDGAREKGGALGRQSMPQAAVYSTCCAIQNLWLAARSEGLGVGWVSIVEPEAVKQVLGIPDEITLVAYLCLGYPVAFEDKPMLERAGWETRLPLDEVVYQEAWGQPPRRP